MNIPKINFNTFIYKYNTQKNTVADRNTQKYMENYYQPFFNTQINFKSAFQPNKTTLDNIKNLQKSLQILLTPIKKDFLLIKKTAVVDYFNQFYNLEYGKIAMATEPNFKFVFKDFTDRVFKNEQFSIRIIDLKKGEFDFGFFDEKHNLQRFKLKNNQFYSVENPINPLSYSEVFNSKLEGKLNDIIPVINEGIEKVNNIAEIVFKNDKKGYSMFLARGIKKRFNGINKFLNEIEPEKRFALKRSYQKFIPFPNKTALFFKESDKIFSDRLAFVPHRAGEEKLFRIVKFDSESNIKDAYLIDIEKGIFKNFCKRKIFNLKNISLIPKDDTKMTSSDINNTELIPILEKYYAVIDDFVQYIHNNSTKSAKKLLEQAKVKDYLPYNMIKQNFIERLKLILPEGEKFLSFINSKGESYSLEKIKIDDLDVIKIIRDTEKGSMSVYLDKQDCKIIDMQPGQKLAYDPKGQVRHIPYSSDAFKIRTRILQDFINEAFEQNNFIKGEKLLETLNELNKEFTQVSQEWASVCKNKKTEARKLYGESFIAAKGDIGGFRFAIPNKEYSIGLKPHQIGKERFMRLTVYNMNGEIIDNFLLENYSKIIDNYCAQGKYTKDAISRVPDKIAYKTDEQINETNFKNYLNEYLTELKNFKEFFSKFINKNK